MLALGVGNAWGAEWEKVTSAPADWSGEYLLVYESNSTAYVWTGVDAASCYTQGTISSNKITGDFVSLTIATMTGGYSIKVNGGTNNGKYIYGTSGSNKINFGTTAKANTLTYESNSTKIESNTSVMRYNPQTGNLRFRYFKSSSYSSQKAVQLYKKVEQSEGGAVTEDLGDALKWSAAAATVQMDADDNEYPILTNDKNVTVTYSSSSTDVATIDTNGEVTLVKEGTTTISAYYEGGEIDGVTYSAKNVSYTLTVKPAPLVIEPIEGGIIDILTHKTFAATSTQYANFASKQATNENHSDAVYAGRSARNGNATQYSIQLNTIDKGRIATTTSGGIAKRVYVKWSTQATLNTNTRELYVYGSNEAFTGSETSTSTTKIGTIKYTTGAAEAYVDLTGDYKYILMTGSGAIYMDEIQVTWVVAEGTVTTPTISGADEFIESTEVTISAEDGLKVYYTLDGTDLTNASTEYTAPFELTATTTVKAVAYDGEKASDIVSKTFKKLQILTCEEAAELCAATESADKYVIRGYVTNIAYAYDAGYNNISFWMADTKNGGQVFEAYRAQPVAAADKAVKVGDYVEVIGKIVLYNTTPETTQGGTYTIIPAPVVNHTITVSANPAEAGTVTGGGEFEETDEIAVKAVATEGYEFVNWTEGEEVVSTDAEYTFEVLADRALVANFEKLTYTVTATATNGTVEGAGTYEHGAEVTLTATPAEGYEFVNWTEGEEVVSTDAEYTFEVLADRALVANFEKLTYTVTATATNGTVTGAGTYEHGAEVTLTATPAFDYVFVNWTKSEEVVSTENPLTITVAEDVTLEAIFEEVAVAEVEKPGVFSISAHKTATFATGNLQYHTGNKKWRFAKQQYQVVGEQNINLGDPAFSGWIDMLGWSNGEANNYGANPSNKIEDYTGDFVDWGTLFPAEENWSTLSKEDWKYLLEERTNAANLQQVAEVDTMLGILLFPDAWEMPEGVTPTEEKVEYEKEEEQICNFTYMHYTFEQWAKLEEAGAIFLPAAGRRSGGFGNKYNKENVEGEEYKYFYNINQLAYYWTNTRNENNVYYLTNCRLVDKAQDLYKVGDAHPYWGETGRYGQSVRLAKVAYDKHEVTATAENGTVTGAGEYTHGAEVTLTATANEHYVFVNWTKGEEVVAETAEYTFTVEADVELVANFKLDSHTVAATAENGTVTGAGEYTHGAEVTLTATPAEGYEFVNWTAGKTVVSTENPYKFTVTADVALVANFKEKVVAPTKLYLTPNANWKKDNARFAAYFFGNGETWVSMTKVAGETDLYEVTIPTAKKYPNVIFCRMNPSASANNWSNKWNQTADLVIPTDGKNHYTVTAGTWDKGGGTWSIWPVPVVKTYKDITITVIANATPKIHYWEGGDKMVGSNWENKPEMVATGEENTYSYTIKDVDEATGVKYLVVVGDIQSADQITSVNVTKNFKEFLPQVAVQGVNNWDGTDKMTVSDDYQTASITLSLAANKPYELKLTVNGEWFGGKTIAITKDKNSAKFDTNGDGNGSITTDLAGDYVFTYTYETKTLTVAYPVSVTATAENGTVEGAGTYTHGTEVTLTATPAEGYEFVNWTVGEETITENPYKFTVTADVALVANFTPTLPTEIKISGEATHTEYNFGEQFDVTGLVVTAVYSDKEVDITEQVEWTMSPLTIGTTAVEVKATYGTFSATKTCNVTVHVPHNKVTSAGVLDGIFLVSDTKAVKFSTGNLQYNCGTYTWSFAEEQYEIIGGEAYDVTNNTNYGMNVPGYTGKLDLFAWSCESSKYGVNPSNTDADYTGAFVDWGTLVEETGWYTLTQAEMQYLLNQKKDGKALWTFASIEGIKGLMLMPYNWDVKLNDDIEYGYAPKDFSAEFEHNVFTADEWNGFQGSGAAFLPTAGSRTGGYGNTENAGASNEYDENGHYFHVDNVNDYGYYWLNTEDSRDGYQHCASYLIFPGWSDNELKDDESDDFNYGPTIWSREKRRGNSVRLVKETTRPEDAPTDILNLETGIAPQKIFMNGQLIIIKNGVQYNAQGQVVK